jgi:hypothetical protein
MPNPSAAPPSIFHQSESIPRAGPLSGERASCFEPQPATTDAIEISPVAISGTRRARGKLSPDVSRCLPGYPGSTA